MSENTVALQFSSSASLEVWYDETTQVPNDKKMNAQLDSFAPKPPTRTTQLLVCPLLIKPGLHNY
jgi:hypothetical protein